jgi:hypothetical protein
MFDSVITVVVSGDVKLLLLLLDGDAVMILQILADEDENMRVVLVDGRIV